MATPEESIAKLLARLPETTGKSLPEWLAIMKSSKLAKHGEIVKHLKSEFGIGHGYANQIALQALRPADAPTSGAGLVDAQYAGAKAALRPVYEALVAAVNALGKDVDISPKKTCVSFRRSKQFALAQVGSATRVDVCLILKGVAPAGRLEKSPNAMCTHRVRVSSKSEVDAELVRWLKQAYEAA